MHYSKKVVPIYQTIRRHIPASEQSSITVMETSALTRLVFSYCILPSDRSDMKDYAVLSETGDKVCMNDKVEG